MDSQDRVQVHVSHQRHSHASLQKPLCQLTAWSVSSACLRGPVLYVTRDWVGKTVGLTLKGQVYVISDISRMNKLVRFGVTTTCSNQLHEGKLTEKQRCTMMMCVSACLYVFRGRTAIEDIYKS